MDDKRHFHNSAAKVADADIYDGPYDPYLNEGSSQPSAPPQSEVDTPLLHHPPPQQYSHAPYQTISMPIPQNYTQTPTYTYIIRKRGTDGRQFPIQASICLLGCLVPPIWLIACCWPSNNRYEIAWRKVNYCMIALFFICSIFFAVCVGILGLEEGRGHFPETDPVWRIPQQRLFSYFFS